jgi:hypothetical protein
MGRRPMESARGPRISVPIIDPAKRHEVMDAVILSEGPIRPSRQW